MGEQARVAGGFISFKSFLDFRHALYVLAGQINWEVFEAEFGRSYNKSFSRPVFPKRLMAGLHYLECAYDVGDELKLIYY